ncbi:unnamed protein product [Ectocarpus sp. CCAP 1310/34]|nr:unnamed protein product [Ectocarpus sp. CCAP 1310/34]
MLFVVRRLQELGRRKKIPLYMCFVDLKKAYDSVDREMLLKALARAGELGRRKKIPLFMCFVDLNKAYDSVDRDMLWKVLARAGIPAKLIEVIRQFHDGMRARVRMDDGELSDWFFVTQGVRQGCVLSPLLFNICFAEVLEVVVIRFSEDDVVLLRSLVYLKEEKTEARGGGGDTPLPSTEGSMGDAVCR